MFSQRIILLFCLVVACVFLSASAADGAPSSATKHPRGHTVFVLTFEPGADLFSAFGHTALVVGRPGEGPQKVYNFGTYNFDSPNAKLSYAAGDLEYRLTVSTYQSTLNRYRHFGREGTLQELDLLPEQSEQLVELLEKHTLPHERTYQYRHFTNNCTTKVRDLIDKVTAGALTSSFDKLPARQTRRQWTRHYTAPFPLWAVAIDFVLGPVADSSMSRFQEEFLPQTFAEDLSQATIGEPPRPLVSRTETISPLDAPPSHEGENRTLWIFLVAGALFLIAILLCVSLGNRPASRRIFGFALTGWGLFAGVLGAVLLFLHLTAHTDTHFNENHLLAPLTHLWLLVPGVDLIFKGRLTPQIGRATKIYLWASVGLITSDFAWKFIADTPQDNWRFLAAAYIFATGMVAAFHRSGVRR